MKMKGLKKRDDCLDIDALQFSSFVFFPGRVHFFQPESNHEHMLTMMIE
jgi:hypothetical protein